MATPNASALAGAIVLPDQFRSLICRGDVPHCLLGQSCAQLAQIQTARRHVPVQRLDVAVFLLRILQRNIELQEAQLQAVDAAAPGARE